MPTIFLELVNTLLTSLGRVDEMVPTEQAPRVETIVAMVALLQGRPQAEVLEQLYEAGQQSVVDDPQAWGLVGTPC